LTSVAVYYSLLRLVFKIPNSTNTENETDSEQTVRGLPMTEYYELAVSRPLNHYKLGGRLPLT